VITVAAALLLLIGVTGLVVDLGRLYIARNELQAAADAAALAAAYELDGTGQGLERAAKVAEANPNRWNFGTEAPEFVVRFATASGGPYTEEAPPPAAVRFLQVRARATVATYFVPATTAYQKLEAVAAAGQTPASELADQWVPYAPDAVDPEDPEYGFRAGRQYPLRLLDIGAGVGPHYLDAVRRAIVNGVDGLPLVAGQRLEFAEPDWETEAGALDERLAQDTDTAAVAYAEYGGNSRRFLILPVNDPATHTMLGFAGFFLRAGACGDRAPGPCTAEYVGAAVLPGRKGAGPPGAYRVALLH
jgi:hypothetical protein